MGLPAEPRLHQLPRLKVGSPALQHARDSAAAHDSAQRHRRLVAGGLAHPRPHHRIDGQEDRFQQHFAGAGAHTGTLSAMKLSGSGIPLGLARKRMRWLISVIAAA